MTDQTSDAVLRDILQTCRSFACVGVSPNPVRPSYFVARYLSLRGYQVYPINPGQVGKSVFDQPFLPDLAAVPGPVDVVDIFRRPEAVPGVVAQALALDPLPRVIWMQVGVRHADAAAQAKAAGVTVVQDRCPKIEYQRLFGELRMGGFATGHVSARR